MNTASTIAATLLAQNDDGWWDHLSGTGGGWMWLGSVVDTDPRTPAAGGR